MSHRADVNLSMKGIDDANKLGLVVITTALLLAPHLFAAETPKNALSFAFNSSDPTIAYRRSFGMFAGLISGSYSRFSYDYSVTGAPNSKQTDHAWTLGAGLRRYLATKTALQPFVQFDISRSAPTAGTAVVGTCGSTHFSAAWLTGGAEYHVTPSVSIEGRTGIQASRVSSRCSGSDFSVRNDSRGFSTFRSAVSLNFYF